MQKKNSIEHELTESELKYGLVSVGSIRDSLPGPGEKITIYDEEGRKYVSKMHSTQARIDGLTEWFRNHPHVKMGDIIVITLESKDCLKITLKLSHQDAVTTALNNVLETIESTIEKLKQKGVEAFHENNYEQATKIAEKNKKLTEIREKVSEIKKEWNAFFEA